MKPLMLLAFFSSFCLTGGQAADAGKPQSGGALVVPTELNGFVLLPNRTNAIQLRLYTNAAPDSPRLLNTFEIEAYGEHLLPSARLQPNGRSNTPATSLHSVLLNDLGPQSAPPTGMNMIAQAAGPDWSYAAFDVTPAYRDRVAQYRRGILFVAPDLFVIHDHVIAADRVKFQMLLHPPAATQIDPVWQDLRLTTPKASLRINAPSRRELRKWEQINSSADSILPNTITVSVGPTNKVSQLDLITVFAAQPSGNKMDYVFKLVESNTAVGARIHRDGLPTLVAFRLDETNTTASLDSFKFDGPVGVSVFRPKRNSR